MQARLARPHLPHGRGVPADLRPAARPRHRAHDESIAHAGQQPGEEEEEGAEGGGADALPQVDAVVVEVDHAGAAPPAPPSQRVQTNKRVSPKQS